MENKKGFSMLEVSSNGRKVHPTLVYGDEHLVLVDTAYPDQIEELTKAINDVGFDIKDLTEIILTHQDWDHIGCLHDVLKLAPNAKVIASETEALYLEGKKTHVKLQALLDKGENLTEAEKTRKEALHEVSKKPIQISQYLKDGEILPYCGGIEVIYTPGHTPGHISLFLKDSKTMICGDAANIENGKLIHLSPNFIHDFEQAQHSLDKIDKHEKKNVIAHHSGSYQYPLKTLTR